MNAVARLIGKAHDYEVLAASQVYLRAIDRSQAMEAVRD